MKKLLLKTGRKFWLLSNKSIKNIFKSFRLIKSDLYAVQLYQKDVALFDQDANDFCRIMLEKGKPLMISKFGTIELSALVQHQFSLKSKYTLQDYIEFFRGTIPALGWKNGINGLYVNAGFFPNDENLLGTYYSINLAAMQQIDILGSYCEIEKFFKEELKKAKKINIDGYYAPFYYNNPWTKVLKGKKVLVIHPFEKSIRKQYSKRHLIWENGDLLPDFELITMKAEQTMLGQPSEFETWFEALESMKVKMSNTDFDIAIIGAGAYGMPLAAYAKELGKQSVHLAGWTQILFGIKGKRWVDMDEVAKFMNEHWVSPLEEEIPQNFKKVENGCYW
jgi:hypothetical protein